MSKSLFQKKFMIGAVLISIIGGTLLLHGCGLFDSHSNKYGRFVKTGSMHFARENTQMVKLKDGRVVVLGEATEKDKDGRWWSQAEIYDPKTGIFRLGSKMIYRNACSAVLLKDGKILVTGGEVTGAKGLPVALSATNIYDPYEDVFYQGPYLKMPRYAHDSFVLSQTNNVLLVGGTTGRKYAAQIEVVDKNSSVLGPKIDWHRCVLMLSDGRLFFAARGNDSLGTASDIILDIYNVNNQVYSEIGKIDCSIGYGDRLHLIELSKNKILIVLGKYSEMATYLFVYDIAKKTLDNSPVVISDVAFFNALLLKNGKVLLVGGFARGGKLFSTAPCRMVTSTYIFDPITLNTIKGPRSFKPRKRAVMLNNGNVLFVGGEGRQEAELFICY